MAGSGIPDDGDTAQRLRGGVRDPDTGWLDFDQVCELTTEVRERVAALVGDGRVPLVLGGCCTLVPGALAGARDSLGECGVAYLDGHFDLYEGDTSQTGEAADFPLAAAIGRAPQALLDRSAATPSSIPSASRCWAHATRRRRSASARPSRERSESPTSATASRCAAPTSRPSEPTPPSAWPRAAGATGSTSTWT